MKEDIFILIVQHAGEYHVIQAALFSLTANSPHQRAAADNNDGSRLPLRHPAEYAILYSNENAADKRKKRFADFLSRQ